MSCRGKVRRYAMRERPTDADRECVCYGCVVQRGYRDCAVGFCGLLRAGYAAMIGVCQVQTRGNLSKATCALHTGNVGLLWWLVCALGRMAYV